MICEGCGVTFHRNRKGKDARRYCSRPCAFAHSKEWRSRKPKRSPQAKQEQFCYGCGVSVGSDYQPRYCSSACRWRALKARRPEVLERAARYMRLSYARNPGPFLDRAQKRRAAQSSVTAEAVNRHIVWLRAQGRCGICCESVDFIEMHLDHIVPISRGGAHRYDNVQPAHAFCNLSKGARAV